MAILRLHLFLKRSGQILCVFLFLSSFSNLYANSNRRVDWHYYRTKHFKILYHKEVKAQADTAARFLEFAYNKITRELGIFNPRKVLITVTLTGLPDNANGMATPLGHNIIIYTRPFGVLNSDNILHLKRVLAHELTHQITFLALRNFMAVYGEIYKSFYMPNWFMEGVAQYAAENWDTKRNTFFTYAVYNSALEPYANLSTYTKSDMISNRLVYEQGHSLVRYLAGEYGPKVIGRILLGFTAIPVWAEFKQVMSPLFWGAAPYLAIEPAFENAVTGATGKSMKELWKGYQAKLGKYRKSLQSPLNQPVADLSGQFDIVYQIKYSQGGSFYFTGQRFWHVPDIGLYYYNKGRVKDLGIHFIEAEFDQSPDQSHLVYTRQYYDRDGEPVRRVLVASASTGEEYVYARNGFHPVFLNDNSVAHAYYKPGHMGVRFCEGLTSDAQCYTKSWGDSIVSIYALSPSSKGVLFTGHNWDGNTYIYEYDTHVNQLHAVIRDSVFTEFPVEGEDGDVYVLRARANRAGIESFDRQSGVFTPVVQSPLGVFMLHSSGQGSVSFAALNTKPPVPNTISTGVFDLEANKAPQPLEPDTILAFHTEKTSMILDTSPVKFDSTIYKSGEYNSLGQIRPLIGWPYLASSPMYVSIGPSCMFQDPLQLHTLIASAGIFNSDRFLYDFTYYNDQTSNTLIFNSYNDYFSPANTYFDPASGDSIARFSHMQSHRIILSGIIPEFSPVPHSFGFDIGVGINNTYKETFRRNMLINDEEFKSSNHDLINQSTRFLSALWYFNYVPSAWDISHPLNLRSVVLEALFYRGKARGTQYTLDARLTYPLIGDILTHTLWYHGKYSIYTNYLYNYDNDDNVFITSYYSDRDTLNSMMTSLNFPLYRGHVAEFILLGPLNYLGGNVYLRGEYNKTLEFNSLDNPEKVTGKKMLAGGKLISLFYFMKNLPFHMAYDFHYDLIHKDISYGLQFTLGSIPVEVDAKHLRLKPNPRLSARPFSTLNEQ